MARQRVAAGAAGRRSGRRLLRAGVGDGGGGMGGMGPGMGMGGANPAAAAAAARLREVHNEAVQGAVRQARAFTHRHGRARGARPRGERVG